MAEQQKGAGAVLITGTSTGIGRACAIVLDRSGYQVFAGVRKVEALESLQREASGRLMPVILDITDAEQIAKSVETVTKALGPDRGLSGLVNNAGIVVPGPLEFLPIDSLRRQLEVNVIGQVAVTQAFLPLIRKGCGRIINIGSIFGRFVLPFAGAYAISKFGMRALTDAFRRELRPWGIPVSIVEPGAIKTQILEKSFEKANNLESKLSAQAKESYAAIASAARKMMDKAYRRAMSPEIVAEVILQSLKAKRPKVCYLVGSDARMLALVAKFLPDRLTDWVVEKSLANQPSTME